MKIIAAITKDRALGRGGDMLYHISEDLKRFKSLTMGHPIVMGRKTFESFPKGPLPGRRNLVITRNAGCQREGIEVYPSLEAALAACGEAEPYIIGGGEIYAQALPLASELEITEIDAVAPDADTFFPAISPSSWTQAEVGPWLSTHSGLRYRFVTYQRKFYSEPCSVAFN
ncbi:MAG: dihydrofolate reductase [Bacteroidales bacterium]|nr:dihydrofolate reductase [Bacteroidales bacterium]